MQNLTLQTQENRIILRDSTETHPFQLERMSSFTGISLSGPESASSPTAFPKMQSFSNAGKTESSRSTEILSFFM